MSQPTIFRRRRERTSHYRGRRGRVVVCAIALLLALSAGALASGTSALHFFPDSLPAGVGAEVDLDFNPSAVVPASETPSTMSLFLPSGFSLDKRAVSSECTPTQAAAVNCPSAARIGFGHVVVHVSGYLLPGGETDGVVYLTAFLGQPVQPGDPASMVLQAEWLGVEQAFQALNHYYPATIRLKTDVTGRIFKIKQAPYGLEVSFTTLPGGLQVPPPASTAGIAAAITRFKIQISAIRRVKKPIVHRIPVEGLNGPTVEVIHDHVLVGYHLFQRPKPCPSSGQWPWQIQVGFPPDGVQTISGQVRCHP